MEPETGMTIKVVPASESETGARNQDVKKASDEGSTLISWRDFTKETTVHGVKYMFDPAGYIWRRVLWTTIVVAAVAIFTTQVGLRLRDYWRYETITDVEQVYEESVTFPVVTICNQNAYRISNVQEWNIYDFIDEFYQDQDAVDPLKYDLDRINTDQFILNSAHQRDDIIESCQFLGRKCENASFVKIKTSSGVCYSFNSGQESPYTISTAGENGMLRLVLNVETYEHMRGPNNDAGIKIVLHDQGEEAFSEVNGFVVAPGKHFLVNIDQTKHSQKPYPYGDCNPNSNDTMAECTENCLNEARADACKCIATHMGPYKEMSICSMERQLYCFYGKERNVTNAAACPQCTAPCYKTSYHSKVSFAELSKYNVERMIWHTSDRRERIVEKFLHANEIRQRVVKETVQSDTEVIENFANELAISTRVMKKALWTLELWNMFTRTDPLIEVLKLDTEKMDKGLANQYYSFVETEIKLNDIEYDLKSVQQLMKLSVNDNSELLDGLTYCNELGTVNITGVFDGFEQAPHATRIYGLNTIVGSEDNSSFDAIRTWTEVKQQNQISNDLSQAVGDQWEPAVAEIVSNDTFCQRNIPTVVEGLKKILWRTVEAKRLMRELLPEYNEMIGQSFYNTGTDPSKFPEHSECMSDLNTLLNSYAQVFNVLPDALNPQALSDVIELTEIAVNISLVTKSVDFQPAKQCNWVQKYNNMETIAHYLWGMKTAKEAIIDVTSFSPQLETFGLELQDIVKGELKNASDLALAYLAGNVTKLTVAELFAEVSFQLTLEDFYNTVADYKRKASEMMSAFMTSWFRVKWVFEEMIGLFKEVKVPIMNESFVDELNMTKRARPELVVDFKAANETRKKMKVYYDITAQVFQSMLGDFLNNASEKVADSMRELKKAITRLSAPLEQHRQDCQFGPPALLDNFLQVDLFYQEIKYVQVTQKAAFEILSLFGEVGGFLGLLLGASIMTVCEFLDYLSLKIYFMWVKKKAKSEEKARVESVKSLKA